MTQQHPLDIMGGITHKKLDKKNTYINVADTNDINATRLLNDPMQSASALLLNKNEPLNKILNGIDTNNNTFKNKPKMDAEKENNTPPPPGTLFVMF